MDEEGFFAHRLSIDLTPKKREVLFIVDRSAISDFSPEAVRVAPPHHLLVIEPQALRMDLKEAVAAMARSLDKSELFNVLAFNSLSLAWEAGPVWATRENVADALDWLAQYPPHNGHPTLTQAPLSTTGS